MTYKYNRVLVIDTETSGLPDSTKNQLYYVGPQILQLGCCLVEDPYNSWTVVDEFEISMCWVGDENPKIVWYPHLTWSEQAEQVHGLTKEFISKELHPQLAAHKFNNFLKKPTFSRTLTSARRSWVNT